MRPFVRAISCLSALLVPAVAHASEDTQYWQTANVAVDLGGGFRASNETVFRSSDAKGFYEIEDNFMVGYKPTKKVTLWLGYTHDPNYSHGNFTVMEHRIRQQVSLDNIAKLGPVSFSGRLRLEERWREGVTGTAWRLRPYVKAALPIANKGKTQLVVTHESFLDLNTTGFQKVNGEDRMRNFIGINTPLLPHVGIEAGYLNQHGFVRNGPDSSDHVLMFGVNASF